MTSLYTEGKIEKAHTKLTYDILVEVENRFGDIFTSGKIGCTKLSWQ